MKLKHGNNGAQVLKKLIDAIRIDITFQVFLDPAIRGYLDLAEAVKGVDAVLFVL